MTRRSLLLALLSIATTYAQETNFGEWQTAEAPALRPGQVPAWDDTVSVVKLPDKWAMLYEGVALSEDGRTHGFGIAESADGISWKKRPENPVREPGDHEWEVGSGPSGARRRLPAGRMCRRISASSASLPDPLALDQFNFSIEPGRMEEPLAGVAAAVPAAIDLTAGETAVPTPVCETSRRFA